jgi:hypothetical protein
MVLIGAWITVEFSFPFLEYASERIDNPQIDNDAYEDITAGVSQFLWENRSLDLISQSFVILAAVICCLTMLKVERRHP